ncbi:GNAT family N-acetyltransferase [Aliikangiella maris]|uniref:GNAT family N-acetyltransferase n=2 Tax=Aliikangiella maris TaxID=3162458 RepID=A0ABV2BYK9_9GAMM
MPLIAITPRLELRAFSQFDAPGFYQMNLDPEVLRYTGDKPFVSVDEAAQFIENYSHYRQYGYGRWSIYLRESQQYIGFCGLRFDAQSGETDIGYRLQRAFWHQGLATEAAQKTVELAFNKYELASIIGRAVNENIGSHRILTKLGFKPEQTFIENQMTWQQYRLIRTD